MRRLILFLQSAAALTRHEATVLLWLTGLVLLGTIGGHVLPETSLHAHMPPQQLLALLDSADENPIAPDSAAIASQPSRSKTTPSLPVVVHVNTASAAQLETIPGIGPATARSIIEYRQRRRLTSAEDLLDVKGIGKKKLERMRPFITVP